MVILIAFLVITATAIAIVCILIAVVVVSAIGVSAVVGRRLTIRVIHAGAVSAPVVATEARHGVLGLIGVARIRVVPLVSVIAVSIGIAISGTVIHAVGIVVYADVVIEVIVGLVVEIRIVVCKPGDGQKCEERAQEAGGEGAECHESVQPYGWKGVDTIA
ncbi:hypothetical protein A3G69_04380 [Candidatus Peribacteria bacterium RIFCSPLOWO2_12_FULL_53_10]|nr:MAG: hypothetical protein A3G69_04380 [Candidatus Peribacteria bacterium RIFCSPLOWO2_12_FULL_53_10]